MFLTRLALPMALAACLFSSSLTAQTCTGDPGFELTVIPPVVPLGTAFGECFTMPAGNWTAFVVLSLHTGTTHTIAGDLCVTPPFLTVFPLPIPRSGVLCLGDRQLPCDASLIGIVAYWQFVAVAIDQPKTFGISNLASLSIVDGACNHPCDVEAGAFVTFTQGGWGTKCAGNNPGCLRDANFANVFPGGLILGDKDGPDADTQYALLLTTSAAVQNFLPEGSSPGAFTADATDVANATAGVFAGQLAAAMLNLAFDDAGVFDFKKSQTTCKLGELVYVQGVNAKLIGLSVREVIDLSNLAISGALTAPIDVDGDNVGDVSLSDLSTALDQLNNNFDNGTSDNGVLAKP